VLFRGSLILEIVAPEESEPAIQEWPPVQLFPGAMILSLLSSGSEKEEKGTNSQLLRSRLPDCIDGCLVICQHEACGQIMRLYSLAPAPASLLPLISCCRSSRENIPRSSAQK
jgi:hypothetical protein